MKQDLSTWPGTLWEADRDESDHAKRCTNCGRSFDFHGTREVITRRLGFRLNQQHLVCRPQGDRNTGDGGLPPSILELPTDEIVAGSRPTLADAKAIRAWIDVGAPPEIHLNSARKIAEAKRVAKSKRKTTK